jgi:6-pyruvoyltetrahydropterin/6-carboxytetrahydropterin synthase
MLLDFGEFKTALRSVLEGLDHSLLNDEAAFEDDPSAERIAQFVFKALAIRLPLAPLHAVEVFETETSMARYEP